MPSHTAQDEVIQYVRPLERLGGKSGHTAWISKYVVGYVLGHVGQEADRETKGTSNGFCYVKVSENDIGP
jgi:hypothetical protein